MNTNFDIVDAENGYKQNGTDFPLTSPTTKTVGAGKDFETLRLALDWILSLAVASAGHVTLVLDDGIHSMGEPADFNSFHYCYMNLETSVRFASASGSAASCTITLPSTDDGDAYPSLFYVSNSFVSFEAITLSADAGGYLYPGHASCIGVLAGGKVQVNNCVIENFDDGFYVSGGELALIEYSGKGFTVDSCTRGIAVYSNGFCFVDNNVVISNCTTGIDVGSSSKVVTSATMTTNTADYSRTLNEIGYDGGFISSNTAALTLKA